MAADLIAVMQSLSHERFLVAGHDRGGRWLTNQNGSRRSRDNCLKRLACQTSLVDGLGLFSRQHPSPDPQIIHHQIADLDAIAIGVPTGAILAQIDRLSDHGVHSVEACGDIALINQGPIQIGHHFARAQKGDHHMVPPTIVQGAAWTIVVLPLPR